MVVGAHFAMRAAIGAFGPIGFILGVAPHKEQVRYLILNEMVASVITNPILMPKNHFTTIVLAMVVTEVFNLAALEAAAFAGIKMKHVRLPGILGYPLPNDLRE